MLYIAPLFDFSGYAHAARDYIRALDKAGCDLVTRAVRYDNGDYKFTEREQELFSRDTSKVNITIQQTTPNETERKEGVFNVNYFAWETDRVPNEWVSQLNQMDLVLVPCEANVQATRKSGVVVPVVKIPHTFDKTKYNKTPIPLNIDGMEGRFKFLAICQYAKKKGIDALLKSYFAEFRATDNVMLILKMYLGNNDGQEQMDWLAGLINEMKDQLRIGDYAPVLLLNQVMSDNDINRLYATCDAYVMPSRGEGWSITHFDAMGWGLPPIAVNWGGPTEFITKKTGWLTDFNMSPVCGMKHPHPFMYTGLDSWAEPHVNHLRQCMREAVIEHDNEEAWNSRVKECKKRVEDFSYEVIGPLMKETIMSHYEKWRS